VGGEGGGSFSTTAYGGWNGGGPGGSHGGGGASDVRTGSCAATVSCDVAARAIVGGGGGGGGDDISGKGGEGGGLTGGSGSIFTDPAGGGGGGTQEKGGAGGQGQPEVGCVKGSEGGLGLGGAAANGCVEGGGGGGGYYGGGGGGAQSVDPAGGGGGSGFGPVGVVFHSGVREENGLVKVTYTVPVPKCTTAVGKGTYLKLGETGRLNLNNTLSMNLAEPQKLRVAKNTGEVRFRLLHLLGANCEGFPGERAFSGFGEGAKGDERGYELFFKLSEKGAGNFFFESLLLKEGVVIEASGGPLKTASEKIS